LSLPVATGSASGSFNVDVLVPAESPNPLDAVVFPATLVNIAVNPEEELSDGALSLPKHEESTVSATGGVATADEGRIEVTFSDQNLTQAATVDIGAPVGDDAPAASLSGQPFEINAEGNQTQQELDEFPDGVSIMTVMHGM
jgi:hypothetical protein